jgi:serine/threonine protein phosphatase PrpC
VALLLHGRHCVYLWAGDSRAYLLRNGVLEQLTTDHSQVELYVKLGLISREEASTHPSSNMVTRAIGADDQLCLDLDMLEAYAGDRYLLCSDGLHKHLSNNDIAQVLVSGSTANVARALIDMTLARGATDNVTVAVIDVFDQTDKTAASADLETTVPGAGSGVTS